MVLGYDICEVYRSSGVGLEVVQKWYKDGLNCLMVEQDAYFHIDEFKKGKNLS